LAIALDFTSLEKEVQRLNEGLVRYKSDVSDTQIRDGLIQRFELTYEISHKMLRRYLEASAANPTEFDTADFQYLSEPPTNRVYCLATGRNGASTGICDLKRATPMKKKWL